MFQNKNILTIAAHPDDLEFGAFGTLYKHRSQSRIWCYVATWGGELDDTSGKERQQESAKALALIDPLHIWFHDSTGISHEHYPAYVHEIEQIVRDYKINLVITLSPHDTHQDHRLISEISFTALRRSKASIVCYPQISNTLDYNPRLFVDITDVLEVKKQALFLHRSQKDKYYMSDQYFEIFNSDGYASLHGLRYSEKFEIVRYFG